MTIDIDLVEANFLNDGVIIRKLAARKKIQELEESKNVNEYGYEENEMNEDIKKTIIQLGLENSLTSQYTSFVGIDVTTGETLEEKPMWTREIKNQVASGYGGTGRSAYRSFGGGFGSRRKPSSMPMSYVQPQCLVMHRDMMMPSFGSSSRTSGMYYHHILYLINK